MGCLCAVCPMFCLSTDKSVLYVWYPSQKLSVSWVFRWSVLQLFMHTNVCSYDITMNAKSREITTLVKIIPYYLFCFPLYQSKWKKNRKKIICADMNKEQKKKVIGEWLTVGLTARINEWTKEWKNVLKYDPARPKYSKGFRVETAHGARSTAQVLGVVLGLVAWQIKQRWAWWALRWVTFRDIDYDTVLHVREIP